ncbi:hypothetical protein [Granulicella sp. L60]|uniref:hypothetical protein n=1 Tax=Granulicella sp. L60 TaxID=1641866 RepID=UPI00131D066B|nr:hypothetical protein [Granulicella sp. L60]
MTIRFIRDQGDIMDTPKICLVVLVGSVLAVAPIALLGQAAAAAAPTPAAAPAPCSTDAVTQATNSVSGAATTVSKDTTTLANAGTQLNTAEQKFNTMLSGWKKPKPPSTTTPAKPATTTTATATNTTTAKLTQVAGAANSSGTTSKAPCQPAKPAAAGTGVAANGKAPTPPAAKTEMASADAPTFTLMPDGDYMLGYTGTAAGSQAAYAKVKMISPAAAPTAANPHDGVYTDGKSYYMVTGGKLTVTPIGGVASK